MANATVTLRAYDSSGNQLTSTQIRSTMKGQGWDYTDTLIHQTSLQVLKHAPLYNVTSGVAFEPLSQSSALAVNWPTARGYSLLIIDNGGAGFSGSTNITLNLNYRAALDVKRRLDDAIYARPDYVMSSAFIDAYDRAKAHLETATASANEATRGKYGQLALDELATAQDLMLAEYGIAYSRANLSNRPPQIGLTIDRIDKYINYVDRASQISPGNAWVRIVFDPGMAPSYYTNIVNAAKQRGIKVLGQPVDSSGAKNYSRDAYLARFKQYVDAFPQIDAWEAGNEVNGSWLGTGMELKIADAAAYIRSARPDKLVYVTLYWQVGTDYAQWSTFNWARANLPASTRANVDVIALSTFVEDAPMGLAMDQVFKALNTEFPQQKIVFGELDYWLPDTSKAWWAFDKADPTGAGRRQLAAQYYAASLGYGFSLGGGFWWNFAEYAELNDPSLDVIASVASQATMPLSSSPLPAEPVCARTTPAISLSGPTEAVAAGTSVSYAFKITNQDSAGCPNTSFSLARSVPTGWTGTLSASSFALAPGASSTSTLVVTSSTSTPAGTYNIGGGASSSVGNVHTTSTSAGYSVKDATSAGGSTLSSSVGTNKTFYLRGETVFMSARPLIDGQPAAGTNVRFTVLMPDGTQLVFNQVTDGNGFARSSFVSGKGMPSIGSYKLIADATNGSLTSNAMLTFSVVK
ncbi:MAG: NEW3 domain-containing protein [Thermomonas sp.]